MGMTNDEGSRFVILIIGFMADKGALPSRERFLQKRWGLTAA
jgi:hypothetical protein